MLRELKRLDARYEDDLAAKGGINPFEHLDDLMTEEALADRPAWEEVPTDDAAWDGGGGTLDLRKMRAALAEESAAAAANRPRIFQSSGRRRPPTILDDLDDLDDLDEGSQPPEPPRDPPVVGHIARHPERSRRGEPRARSLPQGARVRRRRRRSPSRS